MTTQNDVLREIEKLVRVHMAQLISDDEFCENVILRMVHADQSNWPEMLNATGSIGSEKLQTYCKRIALADAMPLHEALMVPKLSLEAKSERIENLRSVYGRLSDEILNWNHGMK